MVDIRLRRGASILVALLTVVTLTACGGDDDDGDADDDTSTEATSQVSTEGACGVLDIEDVSAVLEVEFDKATLSDNACTYTSSRTQLAMTLHATNRGDIEVSAVLDTMSASCDPGTVQDRTFTGADGGFSCLAGGVPNVVATGGGVLLVLVGNSREPDADRDAILEDLVTILEDAIENYDENAES